MAKDTGFAKVQQQAQEGLRDMFSSFPGGENYVSKYDRSKSYIKDQGWRQAYAYNHAIGNEYFEYDGRKFQAQGGGNYGYPIREEAAPPSAPTGLMPTVSAKTEMPQATPDALPALAEWVDQGYGWPQGTQTPPMLTPELLHRQFYPKTPSRGANQMQTDMPVRTPAESTPVLLNPSATKMKTVMPERAYDYPVDLPSGQAQTDQILIRDENGGVIGVYR